MSGILKNVETRHVGNNICSKSNIPHRPIPQTRL